MASLVTNRGRFLTLEAMFRSADTFNLHLVSTTPTVDTNTLGELTETSNYTPEALTGDATDFDVITEDDGADEAFIQIRDVSLPVSGAATATYAVLTDDNVTVGSRQVIAAFDLGGTIVRSSGQTFDISNAQITAGLPA